MSQDRPHDPFSAHSATSGGFPAARLARAGVADEASGNLAAWYAERSPQQQAAFRKTINSASDDAIRQRFTAPDGDLGELLAEQLHDLALAAGVATSGTKAEVAARIAEGRPQQPAQPSSAPQGAQGQPAGQQQAQEGQQETQQAAQRADAEPSQPAEAAQAADTTGEPPRGEPQVAPQPAAEAAAEQERPRRRGGSGKDGQ